MGLDPVRGAGVADVADAFSDLRHAVHQALEVVGLEDEELRVARRADGGVADVAGQDRDLAEEVAVAPRQTLSASMSSTSTSPRTMKYIASAVLAAARDDARPSARCGNAAAA